MGLPSGYKRLEYIQSSGTQYVDTGVSAPSGFQADIDFELASLSTTSINDAIIGAHNDSAPYSRNYFAAKAAGFEVGVGEAYLQGEVPTTNERYMVDVSTVYSDIHLVVNSVEHSLTTDISATDEHSANTLYLLWCHGGSKWFSKCACKLYACRIYASGKLVRDFIPCISDTDEVGLWDDVNAVFYGNAGTGTFTAGPVIAIAADESEIIKLEYIQSSGTQYIDTNVSAPKGFRITCDAEFTSLPNTLNMLFGSHDAASPYYRNFLAARNTGKWEIGAYNPTDFGSVSVNTKYSIDVCTISGAIGCSINGIDQIVDSSIAASTVRSSRTVYVFGLNYPDGLLPSNMKLYGLKMYLDADGSNLVRDYIPAKLSDGTVGLYDKLNGLLYINVGTGTFISGGYISLKTGDILNYDYTGTVQSVTLPKGVYKLEVWGAQGGSYSSYYGGAGGYSAGTITFTSDTPLYIYVGGQPATNSSDRVVVSGGFNGGGNGYNRYYSGTYTYGQGGGGGTDIRIGQDSLYARVIVAGGGGGSASVNALTTKYGGGITGGAPTSSYAGTQTTGGNAGNKGTFGQGGSVTTGGSNYRYSSGGGGGGWYGGGAASDYTDSSSSYRGYNGGGSGFVWTGSNAPSGYLLGPEYYLTDASTIAGNASMPSTSGGTETGHTGNGYARITVIKVDSLNLPVNIGGTWKDANEAFVNIGGTWKTVEAAFVNIGGTWKELG